MAFLPFPKNLLVKTFNDGVTEYLAQFTADKTQLLRYVVLTILKNGTSAGSESLQLSLFSSSDFTKPALFTSDARLLSDTGATNSESWIGRLRFDFDDVPIDSGSTYYLAVSCSSYTRASDFYLGAILDWPYPVYEQTGDQYGAQFRLIGVSERSNDMSVGGEIRQIEVAEGTVVTATIETVAYARNVSVSLNGSETSKVVDVSTIATDADTFIWVLKNASGKQILCDITGSGTNVTISTDEVALPAGTYKLYGV